MKVTRVTPVVSVRKHKTVTRDDKPTPVSDITNKPTGVATQKVRKVQRLDKPFEGSDTLMDFHRAKAKSSISEACKDADYATAGWRELSEWEDFKKFSTDLVIVIPLICLCLYMVYEIFVAMGIVVVRV
jgi:hypothetical protein